MRAVIELLRAEGRARIYFAVLAQSSLGNGAAYVGLLLVAYDRFESPWAVSLVLLADLVPAMVLGPVFGAAADRWSRKACMVLADIVRAGAFAGVALVGSFEATIAFAILAGVGTGLFTPAALAALPSLVEERRLPAATSLYGAITDVGFTAGPALAAGILLMAGPESIMTLNSVTFAASAVVLAALSFGAAPAREAAEAAIHPSLLAEARDGLRAISRMTALRIVLLASAAALFFGGLFNVAELPFVRTDLDAGDTGFAVLVGIYGLGFISGSLAGAAGGAPPELKRRYLLGLLIMGGGFIASGFAPGVAIAMATFVVAGFGNGLMLVYERLLILTSVPDRLAARVFGVKDALTAWAFAFAFLSAGGLVSLLGARELLVVAGSGGLVAWAVATLVLRSRWTEAVPPKAAPRRAAVLSRPSPDVAVKRGSGLYHGTQLLHGGDFWLALLDDLDEGRGGGGVELGSGVRRELR